MSISLASDDLLRGKSTSDHRPVATLGLSYDDASGVYVGASATAGPTRDTGVRLLGSVQYAGYAQRTQSGLALDIGVTNRIYGRQATTGYARRFAEGYVGAVGRRISSHLFYAPHYSRFGKGALYWEGEALLLERGDWSLSGHVGLLHYLASPRYYDPIEADWRLRLSRRLGRNAIGLALVGSTARDTEAARATAVVSVSTSF